MLLEPTIDRSNVGPSDTSIGQAMGAMLGGANVTEMVVDCTRDLMELEIIDAGIACQYPQWILATRRFLRCKNYSKKALQCPYSGKVIYHRDVVKLARASIKEKTRSQLTFEDVKNMKSMTEVSKDPSFERRVVSLLWKDWAVDLTESRFESFLSMINEGDESYTDFRAKLCEKRRLLSLARDKHYNRLNRVKMELLEKTKRVAPVAQSEFSSQQLCAGVIDILDRMEAKTLSTFSAEVYDEQTNESGKFHSLYKNSLYRRSRFFNDDGEQDFANMSFYHETYSSLCSCTVDERTIQQYNDEDLIDQLLESSSSSSDDLFSSPSLALARARMQGGAPLPRLLFTGRMFDQTGLLTLFFEPFFEPFDAAGMIYDVLPLVFRFWETKSIEATQRDIIDFFFGPDAVPGIQRPNDDVIHRTFIRFRTIWLPWEMEDE